MAYLSYLQKSYQRFRKQTTALKASFVFYKDTHSYMLLHFHAGCALFTARVYLYLHEARNLLPELLRTLNTAKSMLLLQEILFELTFYLLSEAVQASSRFQWCLTVFSSPRLQPSRISSAMFTSFVFTLCKDHEEPQCYSKVWLLSSNWKKNEDGGTVECDSTYARKRCVQAICSLRWVYLKRECSSESFSNPTVEKTGISRGKQLVSHFKTKVWG